MKTPIEDKLRKLGGVLGENIKKLQWAYQAESNGDRKRQLETKINLLYAKHFGFDDEILLMPPSTEEAQGEYWVGAVQYNNMNLYPFGLRESDLSNHGLIAGRSGSGKTNLVQYLAKQFVKNDKKFLLLSFKREYRQVVQWAKSENKEVLLFTCGRPQANFHLNILTPPRGTDLQSWINLIAEAIADVYFLKEGAISFLRSGLSYIFEKHKNPKIIHLKEWVENQSSKGRAGEWLASTKRVLDALCFGRLNEILNSDDAVDFESLLDKNVVLEIDVLNTDDRTLIIQCLLRWLYKYALQNFPRNECKYVLIIDEAHHVFRKGPANEESYSDMVLRMAREVSLSILLSDQHPSLLSLPARGDTATTIALNLKTNEDITAIGSSLLFDADQKKYIGLLTRGQAIIRLPDRFPTPFLVQIPRVSLPSEPMTDDLVATHMKPFYESRSVCSGSQPSETHAFRRSDTIDGGTPRERVEREEIGNLEHAFLMNVIHNPFIATRERYNQLRISVRHGGMVKDKLVINGYLKPVAVDIYKNTITLFELTEKAFNYLTEKEVPIKRNVTEGGIEHRFGSHLCKTHFESLGFTVESEVKTEKGKYIDIIAKKDEQTIALLVETGFSDIPTNITAAQDAGITDIRIIATNKNVQKTKFDVPVIYLPDFLRGENRG